MGDGDTLDAGGLHVEALFTPGHAAGHLAFLVDGTLAALDIRRNAPWFAHVTFIRPHPPLVAPSPYNILVDPDSLPPPVAMTPDHPLIDAWFSEPCQTGLYYGFDGHFPTMQPETVQQLRAIYLGLLAEVDLHLGRLLDWLETTGQAGRTLVIVTGDHGDVLGDHGPVAVAVAGGDGAEGIDGDVGQ